MWTRLQIERLLGNTYRCIVAARRQLARKSGDLYVTVL